MRSPSALDFTGGTPLGLEMIEVTEYWCDPELGIDVTETTASWACLHQLRQQILVGQITLHQT